jgi:hypothetical protein
LRFQLVTDAAETRKGFRFDDFVVHTLRYASAGGDTVPNDTIPNDTIPNDTIPNDTIPNDTIPNDTIPNDTIPNDTVPNDTVPNDTVPNDTVPNAFWNAWQHKIRANVVEHFPNPVSGRVTFRYFLDAPYRKLRLELYNALGETVRRVTLPDSQTDRITMDWGDLPSGTYFYRLTSEGKPVAPTGKMTKM